MQLCRACGNFSFDTRAMVSLRIHIVVMYVFGTAFGDNIFRYTIVMIGFTQNLSLDAMSSLE